jgi:hypothetical protein
LLLLFTLIMKEISSFETSVFTRSTGFHVPEGDIRHEHGKILCMLGGFSVFVSVVGLGINLDTYLHTYIQIYNYSCPIYTLI